MADFKRKHGFAVLKAIAGPHPKRFALRLALTLMATLGLAGLLRTRLADLDLAEVSAAIASVHPVQWLLALVATAISFWAVGQYDVTLHRHLRSGALAGPDGGARAGIAAIAVSQTLGLGIVTGALLRWRLLPGADLWQATRLTVAVTLSFLAGWALVTALTLLALPDAPFKSAARLVILVAAGAAALVILSPPPIWRATRLRLPNTIILGRMLSLAALDTGAAALALYALCPPELQISFAQLLPAYLLALGAGLLSGTPGGVGAFEMTLLTLLPGVPEAPFLAAVVAFRLIYYAAPAMLGAALAGIGPARARPMPTSGTPAAVEVATIARQAEAMLIRQGILETLSLPHATLLVGRTPHHLVALLDPLTGDQRASFFAEFERAARRDGLLPCLYKCGPRTAALARAQGYSVLPVAREAFLEPTAFSLATPERAALRRKLRRAEANGVHITSPRQRPLAQMAAVANEWALAHGGERGFSMGRYSPQYVADQRVYLAWVGSRLVGFISLHDGAREWALDLMRHRGDAPDGTMPTLIVTALQDAAKLAVQRFSLAAVPEAAFDARKGGLPETLIRLAAAEGTGLMRFKSSFAPRWQRRYLATPSRFGLPLAGAEIARAILYPPALEPDSQF